MTVHKISTKFSQIVCKFTRLKMLLSLPLWISNSRHETIINKSHQQFWVKSVKGEKWFTIIAGKIWHLQKRKNSSFSIRIGARSLSQVLFLRATQQSAVIISCIQCVTLIFSGKNLKAAKSQKAQSFSSRKILCTERSSRHRHVCKHKQQAWKTGSISNICSTTNTLKAHPVAWTILLASDRRRKAQLQWHLFLDLAQIRHPNLSKNVPPKATMPRLAITIYYQASTVPSLKWMSQPSRHHFKITISKSLLPRKTPKLNNWRHGSNHLVYNNVSMLFRQHSPSWWANLSRHTTNCAKSVYLLCLDGTCMFPQAMHSKVLQARAVTASSMVALTRAEAIKDTQGSRLLVTRVTLRAAARPATIEFLTNQTNIWTTVLTQANFLWCLHRLAPTSSYLKWLTTMTFCQLW